MKTLSVRRAVVGLSLGALAGVGLVGVPTPAHAEVVDPIVGSQTYVFDDSHTCERTSNTGGDDVALWTDNGVPVTKSNASTSTWTGEEGDVVEVATSSTTTITASPLGTGPASVTGTSTATASVTSAAASTNCNVAARVSGMARGVFTLTKPVWVTINVSGQGNGTGVAVIIGGEDEGGIFWEGGSGLYVSTGKQGTASSSTLLSPGTYQLMLGSFVSGRAHETTESNATYTANLSIDMQPLGAASAVQGKGASKVQFGERDCASGNVAVNLSKKTVKKAARAVVRVNGAKGQVLTGKSLKGRHPKARTIMVPTSATGVTKVKVKIMLENGRRMQATRTYLPCK